MTAAATSGRWVALGLFLAASFAAAGIGVAFQGTNVQDFYRQELTLPGWAPPTWLFGPVWTVLYVAIAVAAWRVWETAGWTTGLTLWVLQLLLNAAWTPAFFNLRNITLALAVILVLLGMIVIMAIRFADHDTLAVALVVPYLAWVTFATALTMAVWWLNPGLR